MLLEIKGYCLIIEKGANGLFVPFRKDVVETKLEYYDSRTISHLSKI